MNSVMLIIFFADLCIVLAVKPMKHAELIQTFRKKQGNSCTGSDQRSVPVCIFFPLVTVVVQVLFQQDFCSFSSEEEKSRCQEAISKLQSILDSEREKSAFVSEQRLKLQQENEQLQKEMEGLRKLATEAQQKAKIKVCLYIIFILT